MYIDTHTQLCVFWGNCQNLSFHPACCLCIQVILWYFSFFYIWLNNQCSKNKWKNPQNVSEGFDFSTCGKNNETHILWWKLSPLLYLKKNQCEKSISTQLHCMHTTGIFSLFQVFFIWIRNRIDLHDDPSSHLPPVLPYHHHPQLKPYLSQILSAPTVWWGLP